MAKVKITGHASGTGVVTITAPNTSTDRTITLPDGTGTLLDENSSLPAANLTGTVADARISALTASKLTGDLPAISGVNVTNVHAVNSGRKNILINGAMQVAQRGMATGVVSGALNADRWRLLVGAVSPVFTVTQGLGPTGAGKSLKYATTTASTTTVANTYVQVTQNIEGLNLQALAKGTSSAKSVTLSFWVKANQTGTYAVNLWDGTATRQNSASYTVSTANTWEKKSIVLGPDTTGTINNDNTVGLALNFIFAVGSSYTGGSTGVSSHSGGGSQSYGPNQTVNVAANVGDYWEVAEVQLEVGAVATNFEHRSYGEELALCQRYYQRGISNGALGVSVHSTQATFGFRLPVEMRSEPTVSLISGTTLSCDMTHVSGSVTWTPANFRFKSKSGFTGYGATNSHGALGNPIEPKVDNIQADAEL